MPAKPLQTSWDEVPVEPLNDLLSRQLVYGQQAMLSRIELKKGCIVPRHQHPHEQIAYIASGRLRFLTGEPGSEQEHLLTPGGLLVIPGNVPHSAEALEDTVNFDLFAPPREDWIAGDDSYLRAVPTK